MPGMGGLRLQEVLSERGMPLPVIFLTGHGDIPMSVKAIKAGAVDFLTKPVTRENLLACVRSALQACDKLLARAANNQQVISRLSALTERERQVMALAIVGHPNKEIARRLGISHRTVEIHKARIMSKTGAVNLLDLARIVHEAGIPEAANKE
jgi:FixJ family two-component response regulator